MSDVEEKKKKEKKIKKTIPSAVNLNRNNICIIGDNVLFNNGIITAYYILPLYNYNTASEAGINFSITNVKNLIVNLTLIIPELEFTIERIEKTIKKKDVLTNLIDSIKIYRNDYEMPHEFVDNLKDDIQDYCLLGINIEQSNIDNIDDYSIKDTITSLVKQGINKFTGLGNMKMDPEKILRLEENIHRTIKDRCVRATKDLVFYNYVSKVFPSYDISYDKLSYINESHYSEIMGSIVQTVSDNFGYFEMHNNGVDFFDYADSVQDTYGCMLDIKSFPLKISRHSFPLIFPHSYTITTVKCLKKDDANLQIKRIRSSLTYDYEQMMEAGANVETLDRTEQDIFIASQALAEIQDGNIICKFNSSLLVVGNSIPILRQFTADVLNSCKDREILVAKSLTQAADFLNNYINKKPKKYDHMAPLDFPLCFQQNRGSTVGDTDDTWSPSIGVDG